MPIEDVREKGDDGIDGDHEKNSYYTSIMSVINSIRQRMGRTAVVPKVSDSVCSASISNTTIGGLQSGRTARKG